MSDGILSSGPALTQVLGRLSRLEWSDRPRAHALAQSDFGELNVPLLLDELREQPAAIDAERSVEKTTHYKWFLGQAADRGFELWLHEYKPRGLRREGHATVPHNHRFWLTSLLLRGGFSDTRYARAESGDEALITPVADRSLQAGDTMVIDPEEIHSLSGLHDGTLSLVVQSRPVRSYSEVFENGEVRRYSDLEARLAELRASL